MGRPLRTGEADETHGSLAPHFGRYECFGQIYFRETDAKLYDARKEKETVKHVMPGTVIVDPNGAFQRNLGAYNNTIFTNASIGNFIKRLLRWNSYITKMRPKSSAKWSAV